MTSAIYLLAIKRSLPMENYIDTVHNTSLPRILEQLVRDHSLKHQALWIANPRNSPQQGDEAQAQATPPWLC